MRTPIVHVVVAAGLLACGGDSPGTSVEDTEASSGSSSTHGSSGPQGTTATSDPEASTTGDGSSSTGLESGAGSTTTSTDADGSGSSTSSGDTSFPVDCDDGGLPVRVEGGGEYATVGEGVTATPPGGTVRICPGDYTIDAAIQIERDLSILGAGSTEVVLLASEGLERVFLVRDASITFEGLAIEGAGSALDIGYEEDEPRVTTMRDLRIVGSAQSGIFVFASGGVDPANAQAVFEDVVVEAVEAPEGAPPAFGGVALYGVEASFVDCSIRDNVTRSGGFEVQDSSVDFEGGEVVRNEALFPNGGGARIVTDAVARPFTIVDSNWGAAASEENTPNDVDCGAGVANDVGWLGDPADAVCGTDVDGCCALAR